MKEARYIRHEEQDAYREAGWTIKQLKNHHGYYSVLAVREVEEEEE